MKQSVNLYLPEFRKQKDWLNAARMVQVAGIAVAVLLLVVANEFWQLQQTEQMLAEADQRKAEATAATEALRASYGTQSEDQSVAEENLRLEEGLKSKQAILEFMSGREMGNTQGFSEHLADLARFHAQGLSLRGISLQDGGRSIRLEGDVVRAELVPIYLQNLSKGEMFHGMNFQTLQISETTLPGTGTDATEEMKVWQFAVSTVQ